MGEAGAERLNQYFKINKDGRNTPGVFQFDIALDSEVYSYGFALSYQDGTIVEEWLYRVYKNGSESKIFERNEEQEVTTDLNISGDAKRRFDVYRADIKTMPKRLFLSEIAKKNVQNVAEFHVFNAVYGWFTRLIVISPILNLVHCLLHCETRK